MLVSIGYVLLPVAFAAPNQNINYQGKLTDDTGATVADGEYSIRFKLYTAPTGGGEIWTESASTTITSGLFSYMLGSTSPLTSINFNQTLYLGVEIGGTGATPTWDGEMTPRKVLGTVPAAFEARQLDGLATTSFLRADQVDEMMASSATTLFTITQSGGGDILNLFDGGTEVFTVEDGGRVGIGTSSPARRLHVFSSGAGNGILVESDEADANLDLDSGSGVGDYAALSFYKAGVLKNQIYSGDQSDDNLYIDSVGSGNIIIEGGLRSVASSTISYLTSITATTTNLVVNGERFTDLTGYGLELNGTTLRVATTTLGLGDGTFLGLLDTPNSYTANRLFYTTASGLASSSNLTFNGNRLGVGTSTSDAILTLYETDNVDIFKIHDEANDTTPFVVKSDGDVAIGTTTPEDNAALHISRSVVGYANLLKLSNRSAGAGRGAAILFETASGQFNGQSQIVSTRDRTASQAELRFLVESNASLQEGFTLVGQTTNNTVRAGFGSSTPSENLVVSSPSGTTLVVDDNNSAARLQLFANDVINAIQVGTSTTDASANLTISRRDAPTSNFNLFNVYATDSFFNGSVGLGTSSPASTLDVWGDVRVGTSGTPTLFADVSTGRIGIGTSTPTSLLSLAETKNASTDIRIHNYSAGAAAVTALRAYNDVGAQLAFSMTGSNFTGYENKGLITTTALSDGLVMGTVGADPIDFATGLTTRLQIDATGNVNVGTTTSRGLLTVDGDLFVGTSSASTFFVDTAEQMVGINTNAPTTALRIGNAAGDFTNGGLTFGDGTDGIFQSASNVLGMRFDGSTRLFFDSSGDIYSTTGHGYRIDSTATVTFAPNDNSLNSGLGNVSTLSDAALGLFSNDNLALVVENDTVSISTTTSRGLLTVDGDFYVGTSSVSTLFADVSTDRVGIGTSTPRRNLHIYGNDSDRVAALIENTNSNGYAEFIASNDTGAYASFVVFGSSHGSAATRNNAVVGAQNSMYLTTDLDLDTGGTGNIVFATGGSDYVNTERMRIDDTGGVSIGTSTSRGLLTVDGNLFVGTSSVSTFFTSASGDYVAIGTDTQTGSAALTVSGNIVLGSGDTISSTGDTVTGNTDRGLSIGSTGSANLECESGSGCRFTINNVSTSLTAEAQLEFENGNNLQTGLISVDFGDATNNSVMSFQTRSSNTLAERMQIDKDGNVLMGTTTSRGLLTVDGDFYVGTSSIPTLLVDTSADRVAIGTSSIPTATLQVNGTLRFEDLGSASANLITDAQGNVSVSSDERLKKNLTSFDRGLKSIMGIDPINYYWTSESGMDTVNQYTGFSAQNVASNIPEAVGVGADGYLTLADRPVLGAVLNAVKEQQLTIEDLLITGSTTNTYLAEKLAATGKETVWNKIVKLVSGFKNGVLELAGAKIEYVAAQTVETKELCLNDECISSFDELQTASHSTNTIVSAESEVTLTQYGVVRTIKRSTSTRVTFDKPFSETPVVIITPASNIFGDWWLETASTTGFEIWFAASQNEYGNFNWQAHGRVASATSESISNADTDESQTHSDEPSAPVYGHTILVGTSSATTSTQATTTTTGTLDDIATTTDTMSLSSSIPTTTASTTEDAAAVFIEDGDEVDTVVSEPEDQGATITPDTAVPDESVENNDPDSQTTTGGATSDNQTSTSSGSIN